jgi:hypothetical protein
MHVHANNLKQVKRKTERRHELSEGDKLEIRGGMGHPEKKNQSMIRRRLMRTIDPSRRYSMRLVTRSERPVFQTSHKKGKCHNIGRGRYHWVQKMDRKTHEWKLHTTNIMKTQRHCRQHHIENVVPWALSFARMLPTVPDSNAIHRQPRVVPCQCKRAVVCMHARSSSVPTAMNLAMLPRWLRVHKTGVMENEHNASVSIQIAAAPTGKGKNNKKKGKAKSGVAATQPNKTNMKKKGKGKDAALSQRGKGNAAFSPQIAAAATGKGKNKTNKKKGKGLGDVAAVQGKVKSAGSSQGAGAKTKKKKK